MGGGRFGGGRFAERFDHADRHARGPAVPFGYYADDGYGYYDPSTVTPDEQPTNPTSVSPYVRPPSSGCTARTYKVPSESGGETSVKIVRC
jgi:hypothetical protein